jgi:putative DNA primase/helicase
MCADVTRSRFVDLQRSTPDFGTFVAGFLGPDDFQPSEKKEDLPLFLPAEFPEGVVVRRCAANVLRVHFLVVDLDKGTLDDLARPLSLVGQYGHVIYTSFSHDPDGQHKYRVIVKLSRPVDVSEWRSFFPRALGFLELDTLADMKCSDCCHMYYIPGGDRSKYVVVGEDGPGLDVDAMLRRALPPGMQDTKIEGYQDVIPEAARGKIEQGLKDWWEGLLSNLCDEIADRPYPGPIYDLKSHRVFGLARGCPHIMDPERLRLVVYNILRRRYARAGANPEIDALRDKSFAQVDLAIDQGIALPWYPPLVNEVPVRPFTEFGLAERFVDQHHANVAYEPSWGSWLTWNERYWDQAAGAMLVQGKMKATIRTIASEADPHYKEYWLAKELYEAVCEDANVSEDLKAKAEFDLKEKTELIEGIRSFGLKSETMRKVSAAIMLASDDQNVMSSHTKFNTHPWLLNFNNGTLNLLDGKFRDHKREDYLTRIAPFAYDEDAKCPRFDRFLSECMLGNQNMVDFLWRAIGYTACGVTDEQKVFFLHGDGANGKSTFLNVLLDLFGRGGSGYGFAANSENLLTNKGSNRHETWRMDMAVVRLVACLEVEEGRALAESLLKELSGSDTITGRRMRENNWSYRPEFTLWLAINHLPHVRGTDEGIWRRICVVQWLANFKGAPERDLSRTLLSEAPGIWARIGREALAWKRHGLIIPREVIASTADYREEQDPLKDFIERWCVTEKTGNVQRDHLWAAYEEYCSDTKTKTFHERKRFYGALEKQFTVKRMDGARMFSGIRLKSPKERIEAMPRSILQKAQKPDPSKPN